MAGLMADSEPVGGGLAKAPETAPGASTVPIAATDDDSEWEYEYSTTETETHYVTLDLSVPDFLNRREEYIVHHTHGNFRPWINPLLFAPGTTARDQRGTKRVYFDDDARGDGEDDVDMEKDNEKGNEGNDSDNGSGRNGSASAKADTAGDNPLGGGGDLSKRDIQILDLHSAEPIVSYQGMIFSGAWAETIGTELLFAAREPESSSATARKSLGQGVDLLGASSARISCTPRELRPRGAVRQADRLKKARQSLGFCIPVFGDVHGERQQQATFLENLMAVKRLKGERDFVTVHAVETTRNELHDGDGDKVRRRRRQRNQGWQVDVEAVPIGRDEGEGPALPGPGRFVRRTVGAGANLSTPTPERWEDLSRPSPGDEEGQGKAGAEAEAGDVDMDENAE